MKMLKALKNNDGFTLMEVVIAMALVTLIASFTATAMTNTQRSVIASQQVSTDGNAALTDCENFLASDTGSGDSSGNYVLKRTDGQLAGFPPINLAIDRSIDSGTDVNYVAFKRAGESSTVSVGGGGETAEGGAGATSGSTDANTGEGGGASGSNEESAPVTEPTTQPTTAAPTTTTEATTQPTTAAPVTEAATQPTTDAPVTETQSEETTSQAVEQNGSFDVFFGGMESALGINKSNCINWGGGGIGILCSAQPDFTIKDDIVATFAYSVITDINQNGILVDPQNYNYVQFNRIHDNSWKYYSVTLHIATTDNSVPKFYVNGELVEGNTVTIKGDSMTKITGCEQAFYITGLTIAE